MSTSVPQPLDYEAPTRRWRSGQPSWATLAVLYVVCCMAGLLWTTGGHVIPGGPFISIHANVIPVVICLSVIGLAWRALRTARGVRCLCVACLILGSASVIILVVEDVMMFWLQPYARGVLLAW